MEAYQLYACRACNKLWVRIQTGLRGRDGGGWIGTEQAFEWRDCKECERKRNALDNNLDPARKGDDGADE